ncbi:MAG: hypothetical protein M1816_002473 [Peltula sp. TS41687]|nr:MAG: hypothetical protein M1816_002473 [Peltula sp. TS41687]
MASGLAVEVDPIASYPDSEPSTVSSDDDVSSTLHEASADEDADSTKASAVIKRQLRARFSAQKAGGTFATSGVCPDAVNPYLHVRGIGTVGLPLSERDAKAVIEVSHQAPYGKGGETIVDTAVRRTFELNSDEFDIRNAAWPGFLNGVLKKVSDGLGVVGGPAAIDARPYKMLLYEEGAMFKAHKDSEKEDRMFGTLVICLPSKHEGGAVRVKHGGETKILRTDKTSEFDTSFLAWYAHLINANHLKFSGTALIYARYADVNHAVETVTEGYRFVITYNLVYTSSGSIQSASTLGDETMKLRNILAFWMTSFKRSDPDCPKILAYMLAHKYTDANLKFELLKGKDQHTARSLLEACPKEDFCVYMANLLRSLCGGCEEYDDDDMHPIDEVYEDELTLTKVVDLNGAILAGGLQFKEDDIVQKSPFARDPDDEEYTGFTGNEGVSTTHFFRNSVVLILPRLFRVDFLFEAAKRNRDDIKSLIEHLLKEFETERTPARKEELSRLCDLVIDTNKARMDVNNSQVCRPWWEDHRPFSDEALGMVVNASIQLQRIETFQGAIAIVEKKLPMWAYKDIGRGLHIVQFPPEIQEGIQAALLRLTYLHERHLALRSILSGIKSVPMGDTKSVDLPAVEQWAEHSTEQALESTEATGKEDAEALVEIIEIYGTGQLSLKALAFAKKNIPNTAFGIGFAATLLKAGHEGKIDKEAVSDTFRHLLSDLIVSFTLENGVLEEFSNKRQMIGRGLYSKPHDPRPHVRIEGETIAYVLGQCVALGLNKELEELFERLEEDFTKANSVTLETIACPFLHKFLDIKLPPILTDRVRRFVQSVLTSYVRGYVQMEPARPRNWSRGRKGCGCSDCGRLDQFLIDPQREIGEFAMAEKRRNHLSHRLSDYSGKSDEFDLSTIRAGSPHTLVVRKTERGWRRTHADWSTRCQKVSRQIEGLGEQRLKKVLGTDGDQVYQDFFQLRMVRLAPSVKGKGAQKSVVKGARALATDVIDLT